MNTGEKIRQFRTIKGFSQEYVGQKLGVSQNVISNIETGIKISNIEDLLKLSIILEVTLMELLDMPVNIEFNNCTGSSIVVYH
jgi:transcriptional regulator with XRE-family HTH domain